MSHQLPIDRTDDDLPLLWLLTEEKLSPAVITMLVRRTCEEIGAECVATGELSTNPAIRQGESFANLYVVTGIGVSGVRGVVIKLVSRTRTFVDCLTHVSIEEPFPMTEPTLVAEVTKTVPTGRGSSRNTFLGQRASKISPVRRAYGNPLIPYLHVVDSIDDWQREGFPDSVAFDGRCYATIGAEVWASSGQRIGFDAFESLDAMIAERALIPLPKNPEDTPRTITLDGSSLTITARLFKPGYAWSDPNVGSVQLWVMAARALGFDGTVVVKRHDLYQEMLQHSKFPVFCRVWNVEIDGLDLGRVGSREVPDYWKPVSGEKVGGILLHSLLEHEPDVRVIFSNHASGALSDLTAADGSPTNVTNDIGLPDIVALDEKNDQLVLIEAEEGSRYQAGIRQLGGFGSFEDLLRDKGYTQPAVRCVVTCGPGQQIRDGVAWHLDTDNSLMVLGSTVPDCITRVTKGVQESR